LAKQKNIKDRYQMFDSNQNRWIKYDKTTNSVMQAKKDGKPFQRIEKLSII